MHDAWTRIFSFPSPVSHKLKLIEHRYWEPLFEIWHVDPEVGGDDRSCERRISKRKQDYGRVHTCWRFWHWRIKSPLLRDSIRWIRARCGLCGKPFGFFAGTCGHLGSSEHSYHPKCYDLVSKRLYSAMYDRWGCEYVSPDGVRCTMLANYELTTLDDQLRVRAVRRCFWHAPMKAHVTPIRFENLRVNGM
jgi:hypothetical protein